MRTTIQQSFHQSKQTHSWVYVIIAHLSIVVIVHTHTRVSQVQFSHCISVPVAPRASLCFWERDLSKCRALTHFREGFNSKARPLSYRNALWGTAAMCVCVCVHGVWRGLQKTTRDKSYVRPCVLHVHTGYVKSIMGRRRSLPHIRSTDWAIRNQAERQAVNFVVQGSVAVKCACGSHKTQWCLLKSTAVKCWLWLNLSNN